MRCSLKHVGHVVQTRWACMESRCRKRTARVKSPRIQDANKLVHDLGVERTVRLDSNPTSWSSKRLDKA